MRKVHAALVAALVLVLILLSPTPWPWLRKLKFKAIYGLGVWRLRSSDSWSGSGSDIERTRVISAALPDVVERYKVSSVLDVGCGDMFWMQHVQLPARYTGVDIAQADRNKARFPDREFIAGDVVTDTFPQHDLALVKEVFMHLGTSEVQRALHNLRESGVKLLLTDVNSRSTNPELRWHMRKLDLSKPPFGLTQLEVIPSDGKDCTYALYSL